MASESQPQGLSTQGYQQSEEKDVGPGRNGLRKFLKNLLLPHSLAQATDEDLKSLFHLAQVTDEEVRKQAEIAVKCEIEKDDTLKKIRGQFEKDHKDLKNNLQEKFRNEMEEHKREFRKDFENYIRSKEKEFKEYIDKLRDKFDNQARGLTVSVVILFTTGTLVAVFYSRYLMSDGHPEK